MVKNGFPTIGDTLVLWLSTFRDQLTQDLLAEIFRISVGIDKATNHMQLESTVNIYTRTRIMYLSNHFSDAFLSSRSIKMTTGCHSRFWMPENDHVACCGSISTQYVNVCWWKKEWIEKKNYIIECDKKVNGKCSLIKSDLRSLGLTKANSLWRTYKEPYEVIVLRDWFKNVLEYSWDIEKLRII